MDLLGIKKDLEYDRIPRGPREDGEIYLGNHEVKKEGEPSQSKSQIQSEIGLGKRKARNSGGGDGSGIRVGAGMKGDNSRNAIDMDGNGGLDEEREFRPLKKRTGGATLEDAIDLTED